MKRAIFLRPVTVRARRIAVMTASEPVLQNVARSIPVNLQMSCAARPASGDCGPISTPFSSCSTTASVTKPGEWPNMFRPNPMSMSTYSFPSTSQSRDPEERTATIG